MKTTNEINEKCIDICNDLLKGEISAEETYGKAISKFGNDVTTTALQDNRLCHGSSVADLRANIVQMGGEPVESSGAWGMFANAVQSAANLIGDESAVSSLIKGEEHGLKLYRDAMENRDVMLDCKTLIGSVLIPRCEKNIRVLESMKSIVE